MNTNISNSAFPSIRVGTWWIKDGEAEAQPYISAIYRGGPHNEREVKLWWEDKEVFTVERCWGVLKKNGDWKLVSSLEEAIALFGR